jgi:hypothetical protein
VIVQRSGEALVAEVYSDSESARAQRFDRRSWLGVGIEQPIAIRDDSMWTL